MGSGVVRGAGAGRRWGRWGRWGRQIKPTHLSPPPRTRVNIGRSEGEVGRWGGSGEKFPWQLRQEPEGGGGLGAILSFNKRIATSPPPHLLFWKARVYWSKRGGVTRSSKPTSSPLPTCFTPSGSPPRALRDRPCSQYTRHFCTNGKIFVEGNAPDAGATSKSFGRAGGWVTNVTKESFFPSSRLRASLLKSCTKSRKCLPRNGLPKTGFSRTGDNPFSIVRNVGFSVFRNTFQQFPTRIPTFPNIAGPNLHRFGSDSKRLRCNELDQTGNWPCRKTKGKAEFPPSHSHFVSCRSKGRCRKRFPRSLCSSRSTLLPPPHKGMTRGEKARDSCQVVPKPAMQA